jgi:hypothetical protein
MSRFIKLDYGIEDTRTGLIWAPSDLEGPFNWADGQKAAAALNLGGFSDWRLPTCDELLTLVDRTKFSPAADPILNLQSRWYWTSTPAAYSPGECAWVIDLYHGNASWLRHAGAFRVRAVRPSQAIGLLGAT